MEDESCESSGEASSPSLSDLISPTSLANLRTSASPFANIGKYAFIATILAPKPTLAKTERGAMNGQREEVEERGSMRIVLREPMKAKRRSSSLR